MVWKFGDLEIALITALRNGEPDTAPKVDIVEDAAGGLRLSVSLPGDVQPLSAIGARLRITGARRYLRNGYHSWDGSSWSDASTAGEGFAVTAFLGKGCAIAGFERQDRFQTRLRFTPDGDGVTIDAETLLDETGETAGETLLIFSAPDAETGLRRWSQALAQASPLPPRLPETRLAGWCSWYNHYAMIDAATIRAELTATRDYNAAYGNPLDIFLIDDGFTPEMGDWMDVSAKFPEGMAPLIAEIAGAGFTPGLWCAPFLVGNRSKLYAAHPAWVVKRADGSGPMPAMQYYGEFKWHKRSEDYYVLDVTHPDAEAYIRQVFRTWHREWGARYFKVDFMYFGMAWGPEEVRWHERGHSRVAVWRKMAALIREEIGDSLLLGCGCPLWASVGLMDAMRIGKDVGAQWKGGEQSAESLLRDQATRNHAHNILWQADPDCILLRDRFHHLSDAQVRTLALYAGLAGGVLMTSDTLSELPPQRQEMLAWLASLDIASHDFPRLGDANGLVEQHATLRDGRVIIHRFDPATGEGTVEGANVP